LHLGWQANLTGAVYGEPLVVGQTAYVATEEDWVYALSLKTGSVEWKLQLGAPVSTGHLGVCGNISPWLGVTSTPVIDRSRNELFVAAAVSSGSLMTHRLFGIALTTHDVVTSVGLDPPMGTVGISTTHYDAFELQRAALTLDQGNVIVAFGGNYGDCGTYHGLLESVPEAGGTPFIVEMDHGASNAEAIWMGGAAPVVTPDGSIWVTTGNATSNSTTYDQSNTVLKYNVGLTLLGSFYPVNYAQLSQGDLDLGSAPPLILPKVDGGVVLQVGKSPAGYFISQAILNGASGGAGNQVGASSVFCPTYGGSVVDGANVYMPCESKGIVKYTIGSNLSVAVDWAQPAAVDPPILAGGYLWATSNTEGTLAQIDPSSGALVHTYHVGAIANDFATPTAAPGTILVPTAAGVSAFVS
jgi:outer membrane protein assembly factor BamB